MAELIIEEPRPVGGRIEVGARFVSSSGTYRLWYRVEEERREALAVNADPFVLGTITLAMKIGEDVLIRGGVSPTLMANLELFQQAWSTWKPELYRQVELRALEEKEPGLPARNSAISGFTGGVDSSFTVYRHVTGLTTRFPLPLRASVMAHGFDIPLDDKEGYRKASEKAERQLNTVGIELYRVETNYRELPVNWVYSFGSAVASVLSLFQRDFDTGLIAAGVPFGSYKELVEGSNPLTDPLLGSSSFRIMSDGAGFDRVEKIAVLSQWKEGLQYIRVCSRNPVRYENCCVCEKCVRNILSFRVLDLGLPPCFEKDVTDEQLKTLGPLKEIIILVGYEPIIKLAEERGKAGESWVRALRSAVRRNRWAARIGRTRVLWRIPRLVRRAKKILLPSRNSGR